MITYETETKPKSKIVYDEPKDTIVTNKSVQSSFNQNFLNSSGPTGLALDTVLNHPDSLPMIGQVVGGRFGGLGAVAGSIVGDTGKQSVEFLKTGKRPDAKEVGINGLVTGLIEGVTRGTGKVLFSRQIGHKTLQNLSSKLGEMKDAMRKNPALKMPSEYILKHLEGGYNSLQEPLRNGKIPKVLRDWIEYLKTKPEVNAGDLIDLERSLGDAAEFGVYKKGAFIPPTDIPNPKANLAAKSSRNYVSDVVDNLGGTEFKSVSKKISNLLKNYPDIDPTKSGSSGFGTRVASSIGAYGATQNPLVGLATYAAMKGLQGPTLRNLVFKWVESSAGKLAGNAARLSLSDYARRKK